MGRQRYRARVHLDTPGRDQPPTLTIWVIYERPADYPNDYVLRPQLASRDGVTIPPQAWTSPTLARIRSLVPPGLTRLPRQPHDDPSIYEVWL